MKIKKYIFETNGDSQQEQYDNLSLALEFQAKNDVILKNAIIRVAAQIFHDVKDGNCTGANYVLQALDKGFEIPQYGDKEDWFGCEDEGEDIEEDNPSDVDDWDNREDNWHQDDDEDGVYQI